MLRANISFQRTVKKLRFLPSAEFERWASGVSEGMGARGTGSGLVYCINDATSQACPVSKTMTFDLLKNEERPRELWVEITRTTRLLWLIAALVLLDGFNRHFNVADSYSQLPGALYDFTVKYKEPLATWYRASARGAGTKDVVIRFEKKYGERHHLTAGYFDLAEVPLLEAYLEDRLPTLSSGNRRFLGYEMAFPIYAILVSVVPTVLLIGLVWNLSRLRRIWVASAPASARLVDDLPYFGSGRGRRAIGTVTAVAAVAVLLVGTMLPSVSLVAQQVINQPAIKGELFVEPIGLPSAQDAYTFLLVRMTDTFAWNQMFLYLLDMMISVFVLTTLLRRKS
jgi:hypothetical protein